jgi:hypothetical protein
MSLTETESVFASVHEDGLNDLVTAFCKDRPRYLAYGSPAFVPVTTTAETAIQAIPFPGIPGGIEWRLRLSIPRIDLFKPSMSLPPELTLGPGEFGATIDVQLCLSCRRLKIDPKPPRPDGREPNRPLDGKDDKRPPPERHPERELTCCVLRLFVIGHIEHVAASDGEDAITFAVDAVEIVDIKPAPVEAVLECLLFMVLQAVLAQIRLPLRALRAGAFQLTPVVGPLIEDDHVKMRGNV